MALMGLYVERAGGSMTQNYFDLLSDRSQSLYNYVGGSQMYESAISRSPQSKDSVEVLLFHSSKETREYLEDTLEMILILC